MTALAAGLAAGSITGTLLTGERLLDVATAMNGALGATVGFAVAKTAKLDWYLVAAATVAVPVLVGGQLDGETIAIGGAVFLVASQCCTCDGKKK